jgi:hypothetical protein
MGNPVIPALRGVPGLQAEWELNTLLDAVSIGTHRPVWELSVSGLFFLF